MSGRLLGNSCSLGLQCVFLVHVSNCKFSVNLVFPTSVFGGNFLIAHFPDHCLLVTFHSKYKMKNDINTNNYLFVLHYQYKDPNSYIRFINFRQLLNHPITTKGQILIFPVCHIGAIIKAVSVSFILGNVLLMYLLW